MTTAKVAINLDPARELADFQTAACQLITHGLLTERYPKPGVLALVRRFEEPLRNELNRLCHWRLDVGPTGARLLRRHVELSPDRPARTASQSRRAFKPHTYALLCVLLAAVEGLGEQTSVSQLADEVVRLRAGDEAIPFDPAVHAHRRAFVDAVAWLEQRGVLSLLDGDAEAYVTSGGDALYDIDGDVASRLLVSPPSVLSGLRTPDEFLDEPYPPTDDARQARARHRVHRRLLTTPAMYYDELPDDEREYARQRRTRIRAELERLTGCVLECRTEGQALIGFPAAEPFPGPGAVAQAALLLGGELVVEATRDDAGDAEDTDVTAQRSSVEPGAVGRRVDCRDVEAAWRRVVASYSSRFTAEYRAEPDRLRDEALAFLARLDLVRPLDDAAGGVAGDVGASGGVVVRPALARFRADVRLPEVLDV